MRLDPTVLIEHIVRGSLCYDCGWVPDWTEHRKTHPDAQGVSWHHGLKPDDFAEMCCAAAAYLGEHVA